MRTRIGGGMCFCLTAASLVTSGCAPGNSTVVAAFPRAAVAAPWILENEVWSGPFEEAAAALGDDAEVWRSFGPTQVWLAAYRHESEAGRKLTVRAFAFASSGIAREAFARFRPSGAAEFRAGDEGCWTEIGVLFAWDRLVFDIFGAGASWENEVQAAVLAGYIQSQMPAELPDAPR